MKNLIKYRFIFCVMTMFPFMLGIQYSVAQNNEKSKVRLKANYVKLMNGPSYIDIAGTAKVDDQNINVTNIDLTIYNEINDEQVELGNARIRENGKGRFVIESLKVIQADSSNTYNLSISFEGNDQFSRASKSLSFKDANIELKTETIDSTNVVMATLIEAVTSQPIADEPLNVQVKRLFKPLRLGGDFINTDEEGKIKVEVEKGIPGIDGNLTLEVVLNEHDDYGTVKALVNAPWGIPIVENSTFDQRTMWSPPSKTPIFLLIVPNLLILGVWGTIIVLIVNLFKIYKSKN